MFNASKHDVSRWRPCCGSSMGFGIPAVSLDHEIAAQVARRNTQEDFAIAGLGVFLTNQRLGESARHADRTEDHGDFLPWLHFALQVDKDFERRRVGGGEKIAAQLRKGG